MSKKKSSKLRFDAAPEYFSLDFEHDRYEMLETPTLQKLCLPPEGNLRELEESGCILPESMHAFLRDRDSLFELYTMGIEGNSELHHAVYPCQRDRRLQVGRDIPHGEGSYWQDDDREGDSRDDYSPSSGEADCLR